MGKYKIKKKFIAQYTSDVQNTELYGQGWEQRLKYDIAYTTSMNVGDINSIRTDETWNSMSFKEI